MNTLFRNTKTTYKLKRAIYNGFSGLQEEIKNYLDLTGASLNSLGERQTIGFFISALNKTSDSKDVIASMEINCGKNRFLDLVLIDNDKNCIVFEGKMWNYSGTFKTNVLKQVINEYREKLTGIYMPNLPFTPTHINHAPLLFEYVKDQTDLNSFRANANSLFNSGYLDFYFDYVYKNEAIVAYGNIN